MAEHYRPEPRNTIASLTNTCQERTPVSELILLGRSHHDMAESHDVKRPPPANPAAPSSAEPRFSVSARVHPADE